MIRLFQLINNISWLNAPDRDFRYYSLLYFDAMETWIVNNTDREVAMSISDPVGYTIETKKDIPFAECSYIAGIREEEDLFFWNNDSYPYLFISSVKLQLPNDHDLLSIANYLEKEINKEGKKAIAVYTTLEDSDILVCLKTNTYHTGYRSILKFQQYLKDMNRNIDIIKITTLPMFCGKRETNIDETVNILIKCKVSNRYDFKKFEKAIKSKAKRGKVSIFGVLGTADKIIQITNLKTDIWLGLYIGKDALLHRGKIKKFGIADYQTEILEDEPNIG